jgi:hypothetical protein
MTREEQLEKKIRRFETRGGELQSWNDRLARIRLAVFLSALAVSVFLFFTFGPMVWFWGSLLLSIPFIVTVRFHREIESAQGKLHIWLQIQRAHLARIRLDWEQIPPTLSVPDRFVHPFARDLDLLGPRSLHQLLDTTTTEEGSRLLRQWLLREKPDVEWAQRQQALVSELVQMPRFRDRLHLHGRLIAAADAEKWVGQRMRDWLAEENDLPAMRRLLAALGLLSLLNLPLLLLYLDGRVGAWWLLPWLLYAALYLSRGMGLIQSLFKDGLFLQNSMERLDGVFGFVEGHPYGQAEHLKALCAPFLGAARPSVQIQKARRVLVGIGVRQNPLLGLLINAVVPWDLGMAFLLGRIKRDLAQHLPGWLDLWAELEALCGLATFGWLEEERVTFPQFLAEEGPVLKMVQMGHPLIPARQRVCNDFSSMQPGAVSIITGSNMAGKSSFLRAIGCNVVLAGAGAPVVAQDFQLTPLRLFASIQVTDSLSEGIPFSMPRCADCRRCWWRCGRWGNGRYFSSSMRSSAAPTIGSVLLAAAPIFRRWQGKRARAWSPRMIWSWCSWRKSDR